MIYSSYHECRQVTNNNAEKAEKLFRDIVEYHADGTAITIENLLQFVKGMETTRPVEAAAIDIIHTFVDEYGHKREETLDNVLFTDIIAQLINCTFEDECDCFFGSLKLGHFNVSCARNIMLRALSFVYNLATMLPENEEMETIKERSALIYKDFFVLIYNIKYEGSPLKLVY